MHKHTIDWLRQIEITCDAALAEKRSETAEKVAKKLTRARIVQLLRLFLFQASSTDFTKQFTEELVDLDPESAVTDNIQYLRLMAGLVMISIFDEPSHEADAFALGIRAASFPLGRVHPVQPEIVAEAEEYLRKEAGRLRLDEFATDAAQVTKRLVARGKAVAEAVTSGDVAKQTTANEAFRESVIETILDSHGKLAGRLEQLAEESGLLWWVFNEHSDALRQSVSSLSPQEYALVAASEAAKRTHIIPPPPCIGPLLVCALKGCKVDEKQPVLADYLQAADPSWRATQSKSASVADCRDLVPISAALEKMEELGDLPSAIKVLPKLCPGVTAELPLAPAQAALQFYNELLFLRVLTQTAAD